MLELPSVTLFCADCVDIERAIHAVERCKAVARFGAVRLLTHLPTDHPDRVEIPRLPSLVDYSIFMLKRAVKFIDTPHALVIQHDGYIINAGSWNQAWLNLDYIGPLFIQDYANPQDMVGSGGFSLRSRAMMQYTEKCAPDWDGTPESTARAQKAVGSYEDGYISHNLRPHLRIGSPTEAAKFAQGGWPQSPSVRRNERTYYVERPFGFHGKWSNIDEATGFVQPPPFVART